MTEALNNWLADVGGNVPCNGLLMVAKYKDIYPFLAPTEQSVCGIIVEVGNSNDDKPGKFLKAVVLSYDVNSPVYKEARRGYNGFEVGDTVYLTANCDYNRDLLINDRTVYLIDPAQVVIKMKER